MENVFTRLWQANDAIEKILATDFSMVGSNGKAVNYDDVINMLKQNAGKRA